MNDTKDILTLLGISADKISNYDFVQNRDGNASLFVELNNVKPTHCSICFEKNNIVIKGYYKTHINNSVIKHRKMDVTIRMRRFLCKSCGHSFKQGFDLSRTGNRISRNIEYLIKEDLKDTLTYSYIAKSYGVSINYVVNLFDSIPNQPRHQLSSIICIDEFHFASNRKDEKYPCVITNPLTTDIIDVIRSRRKPYLVDYFSKINHFERYKVQYFITDMNETYRQIKKTFFPKAIHIADRFHIAKLFTDLIQNIRIKIMKSNEYKSKEYLFLKKHWKLFIMDRKSLNKLSRTSSRTGVVYYYIYDVDATLKKYPELNSVYQAKQDFFAYGHSMMWNDAKKHLDFFIKQFSLSSMIELRNLAKTLSNWYFEIINAFSRSAGYGNLSNACAEATNNVIQTYTDLGYGFSNFDRFRNRILYINRNKTKSI